MLCAFIGFVCLKIVFKFVFVQRPTKAFFSLPKKAPLAVARMCAVVWIATRNYCRWFWGRFKVWNKTFFNVLDPKVQDMMTCNETWSLTTLWWSMVAVSHKTEQDSGKVSVEMMTQSFFLLP
jgi:hypothetical protein